MDATCLLLLGGDINEHQDSRLYKAHCYQKKLYNKTKFLGHFSRPFSERITL